MSYQEAAAFGRALKYATTFDEKLFGVRCDVDIVVNLDTGESFASLGMRPFLRSSPVLGFRAQTGGICPIR